MLELMLIFLAVVMVYSFIFQKFFLFTAVVLNGRVGILHPRGNILSGNLQGLFIGLFYEIHTQEYHFIGPCCKMAILFFNFFLYQPKQRGFVLLLGNPKVQLHRKGSLILLSSPALHTVLGCFLGVLSTHHLFYHCEFTGLSTCAVFSLLWLFLVLCPQPGGMHSGWLLHHLDKTLLVFVRLPQFLMSRLILWISHPDEE